MMAGPVGIPGSSSPYAILCDAGSTGTRLYVYYKSGGASMLRGSASSVGDDNHDEKRQDDVHTQVGLKVKPGLSALAPSAVADYLLPSLLEARGMIPSEHHSTTPVYVYATAGMRLLPEKDQQDLYDALADGLEESIVPFRIDRENFRTIDGDDEGYFAALSVNYLSKRLGSDLIIRHPGTDGSIAMSLLGALDLGGASAQIVFHASDDRRRLHKTGVRGGGVRNFSPHQRRPVKREDFFSMSLLGYGADPIHEGLDSYITRKTERYLLARRQLNSDDGGKGEEAVAVVQNPCYFRGYDARINNVTHVGTGDGEKCLECLNAVIEQNDGSECNSGDYCDLLGSEHPHVRGEFYAMTLCKNKSSARA